MSLKPTQSLRKGSQRSLTSKLTGWSMLADWSALDCAKKPKKLSTNGFLIDLEPDSGGFGVSMEPEKASEIFEECKTDKLRCWFDHFLGVFLEEIFGVVTFRPLPPMLEDGQCADLFKIFMAVRKKGGYIAVSKKGLWGLVTEESGLDLKLTAAVKLIYIKYLDPLDIWLDRYVVNDPGTSLGCSNSDLGDHLMDLKVEFKGFLSEIPDLKENDSDFTPFLSLTCNMDLEDDGKIKTTVLNSNGKKMTLDSGKNNIGTEKLSDCDVKCLMVDTDRIQKCANDEGHFFPVLTKSVENDDEKSDKSESDGGKHFGSHDTDLMILDPEAIEEGNLSNKRKRECLSGLLNWMTMVAKNTCDPDVGSLPDKSKWKSYGNSEIWKQVLLAREAMFLKRNVDSGAEQHNWQKNQKMHPCMYEDQIGLSYNIRERLRCRKKLLNEKMPSEGRACSESSSSVAIDMDDGTAGLEAQTDTTDSSILSLLDGHPPKRSLLGPNFQAEVPEWTGETSESDSKWLGVRVWPLEKSEKRLLIERDPIGKGRQHSCGCQVPGSMKCIRFHIAEKRLRVKRELCSTFYLWRFNKMGEEVGLSWTEEDEKKFMTIVSSNPPSLDTCFWDQILKTFRRKSRAELVNYYFNVFLLRRRGYQNRCCPSDIDSDDDYLESGIVTNGFELEAHKSPNPTSLNQDKTM